MKILLSSVLILTSFFAYTQNPNGRALRPADVFRLQNISDCKVSPDGNWIAYSVSSIDSLKDKSISHIWMSDWEGKNQVQLTNGEDGDETPRWSPDGKYLSFISERHGTEDPRIWLLDRRGGEGIPLTELKGKISEYAWSPDGKKIALVITDPDYSDTAKSKIRKPFVMDKYHFKQDIEGYLEGRNKHLYIYSIDSHKTDTITHGRYNEGSPAWSPDSREIAFVSNRTDDPDRNENQDIWIIKAAAGAEPRLLTHWKGADTDPAWSPDGKYIAYLQANTEDSFSIYNQTMLALIPSGGGEPRILSATLDRPVRSPRWSRDGKQVAVLVADDRQCYPLAYDLKDFSSKKLVSGEQAFYELEPGKNNQWAGILSNPSLPGEIYTLQNNTTHRITHVQDSFLAPIRLATVEGFQSTSIDGTKVTGLLYLPAGKKEGTALPLILYIHGGPSDQDQFEFDLERQMLAAGGFAVAAVNYRGSNGKGAAYCRSIYADWGNKEVKDIQGAANYLIAKGIADSAHLGIMGWSYGGILTDYMIASDTRFKAASSGAGSALQLSMYGVDEYVNQYNNEIGVPWKTLDKWLAISYPFFKADRIKTPTLFMACQSDFNVPSVGAEQMYQALRTLGIPTKLVIYPGQFHEITVPSYRSDRFQRWLDWFSKYLK